MDRDYQQHLEYKQRIARYDENTELKYFIFIYNYVYLFSFFICFRGLKFHKYVASTKQTPRSISPNGRGIRLAPLTTGGARSNSPIRDKMHV